MTPMTDPSPQIPVADPSCGGRLVAADGTALPFRGGSLDADARGGLARVILRQRFFNPHDDPLQVTYQVPLPPDGAVSGYGFVLADRRIVGEVDRRTAARERFEQAVTEGRTAALLEEDRSSLFTQEIGNVPPHTEVTCELTIDQRLRWLEDGQWEWRFPTVVAPRYMGEEGRVADRDQITVDVSDRPLPVHTSLSLRVRDSLVDGAPSSPSHAIRFTRDGDVVEIGFTDDVGGRLDQDIVIRWPVAAIEPGVTLDVARPAADRDAADAAYGLLTLVPPVAARRPQTIPRDLIVLLDTSGSMLGEPLDQAKHVVLGLIDSLLPQDQLELVEFSMEARRWTKKPQHATAETKSAAASWVRSLTADGGTEMHAGIMAALEPLRPDAQRQVILVTDGLIGFEEEVIEAIRTRLPVGCRVHGVGIGSSVNRSLTSSVARAGGGAEIIIGLGEEPETAVARLLARTSEPLVVDLEVTGAAVAKVAAHRLPDLFAGAPALIALQLHPQGGALVVRGQTADGPWERRRTVDPCPQAQGSPATVALYAREAVEDLEVAAAAGERVDAEIERLGLTFQIATRMTSWVAVSEEPSVDPREPTRRVRIPQELPHGMSVEGLGLRPAGFGAFGFAGFVGRQCAVMDSMDDLDVRYASAAAPQLTPRVVKGRIVLCRDGRLVVELTLGEELQWDPAETAVIELDDGSVFVAGVDDAATTRTGVHAADQQIRLVLLDVHESAEHIGMVRLMSGTDFLTIEL